MRKNVVFIDDEISEGDPFAEELKIIVEECGLNLRVLNTRKEIDSFVNDTSDRTGVLLLDRDLSMIKAKPRISPITILDRLRGRNIPSFILSQHKSTVKVDEDFRTLYAAGAIDYIHKSKITEKVFLRNLIYSAVNDVNNRQLKFIVECSNECANIRLLEIDTEAEIASIDYSGVISARWQERETTPTSSKEIIFRIIYEMGRRNSRSVSLINIYAPNAKDKILLKKADETKLYDLLMNLEDYVLDRQMRDARRTANLIKEARLKIGIDLLAVDLNSLVTTISDFDDDKIMNYAEEITEFISGNIILPPKFADDLGKFNNKMKELTNGRIIGRVLSGKKGKGFLYRANIGKVELQSLEGQEGPADTWKDAVEKRLEMLEKEIEELKEHVSE